LKVVAAQDLGILGHAEGTPVLTQWRWYYNVPSVPLWILLLALVVVPQHNRQKQALLILVLPLLAAGFALLVQWLSPTSEDAGQFVLALAIAWASVWLLAPWLAHGGRVRRLFHAVAVMGVVGCVAYVGFFGAWASSDVTWPVIGSWASCCLGLIAGAALTGLCCGGKCTAYHILLWPLVWIPAVMVCCVTVMMSIAMLAAGASLGVTEVVMVMVTSLIGSGFAAVALYMFDLPVLLLGALSSCYRGRFLALVGRSDAGIPTGVAIGKPEGESSVTSPFRA